MPEFSSEVDRLLALSSALKEVSVRVASDPNKPGCPEYVVTLEVAGRADASFRSEIDALVASREEARLDLARARAEIERLEFALAKAQEHHRCTFPT